MMQLYLLFYIIIVYLTFMIIPSNAQSKNVTKYFDLEGNDPFIGQNDLRFSAIESKYLSPNGHGWRNELKKKTNLRVNMYETYESISAIVTFKLSKGAKSVFTQYHQADTSTLLLMIIGDIKDKSLCNGIANDGIFDIYCIYKTQSGTSRKEVFGTAESGDSFDFSLINQNGTLIISIDKRKINIRTKDSGKVYLKFGDYLQAQDPISGRRAQQGGFELFYRKNSIIEDEIVFTNFSYNSY